MLRNRELEINASVLCDSLRSSEARFRSTFEQAAVGIAHVSLDGTWLRVNHRLCSMLGYSEDELLTMTFQDITCADDLKSSLELVEQLLNSEVNHYLLEKRYIRKNGDIVWASVTVSRHCGITGDVEYFIAVIEDISARKAAEQALLEAHASLQAEVEAQTLALRQVNAQLRIESITDQLTGLYNRRYFNERNLEAFTRFKRLGEHYALLLIDIDFFKQINDRFGHDAGDQALRALGEVLTHHIRANLEVAARIGGEEFAVLCHGDMTMQSATKLAERLRQSIAAITLGDTHGDIALTASIGVAMCDEHDSDYESIYRRADRALYTAKHGGRNRVEMG